jgi:SAM-dependent methyltransferase
MEHTHRSSLPGLANFRRSESYPPLPPGAAMRWDVVRRSLPNDPGDVLEVGCGQGSFAVRLADIGASLLALEPDPVSFSIARERLQGHGSILNRRVDELPPEDSFDTVCAFEVLEHLQDDEAMLRQWASRLRPGGTIMISVPAHASRMGAWDKLVGHYRRYDPERMAEMLRKAGLEDISVQLYGHPAGPVLETVRNFIASSRLKRLRQETTVEARTASSGRQLQPKANVLGRMAGLATVPLVKLQRLFPNRGVALLATARRPRRK